MATRPNKTTGSGKPAPAKASPISKKRKYSRLEEWALALTFVFAGFVSFLVWYTDGQIVRESWEVIMSYEAAGWPSRDPGLNCRDPKNINTPYCVERTARVQSDWMGVSRHHQGKGNAFTYHTR